MQISKQLDKHLIDLAWSLWTELGVAGTIRNHHQFLIVPEELIILTAVLAKSDPRLRDEALDWCRSNHQLISLSRLRTLTNLLNQAEPYSQFAATLNSVSRAKWPLLIPASPLKWVPSGKSNPPQFENPALLLFRLRALFGVGARADLLLFYFIQGKSDFSISDTTETGYTKRNLADVLENFVRAGIFDVFTVRNQRRYRFSKQDQVSKILHPLPEFMPSWVHLLDCLLRLRTCIQHVENKSDGTRVVEIQNMLEGMESLLHRLKLKPPGMQSDFQSYWHSFTQWVLQLAASLASGNF